MKNIRYEKFKLAGLCVRCGVPPNNGKTRCNKCQTEHLEYSRKSRNRAIKERRCLSCLVVGTHNHKTLCEKCLIKHCERQKSNYKKMRLACIEAYGKRCICCGLNNQKYLQLDHINNDGESHRKHAFNGHRSGSMYAWAYQNKFPKILQLLCANCHQAKTTSGGCSPEDHPVFSFQETSLYSNFFLIQ